MKTLGSDRQVLPQQLRSFALSVPITPGRRPISDVGQSLALLGIDSIILALHASALGPVYLGDANVIGGVNSNGMQIVAGEKIQLGISNERPLYEVQGPLVDGYCVPALTVPLIVWQLDNMFLTADVDATILNIQLFPVPFR